MRSKKIVISYLIVAFLSLTTFSTLPAYYKYNSIQQGGIACTCVLAKYFLKGFRGTEMLSISSAMAAGIAFGIGIKQIKNAQKYGYSPYWGAAGIALGMAGFGGTLLTLTPTSPIIPISLLAAFCTSICLFVPEGEQITATVPKNT